MLGEAEKARLSEFFQVRQQLGSKVWPGRDTTVIPVIVYNEAYAFLLDYPNPPAGWIKVPQNVPQGIAWELVPDDLFNGKPYYRQPLPTSGATPQAFTVVFTTDFSLPAGGKPFSALNANYWG